MRIVIDMQGAQSTGSRNRGIGRYTLSLTQAIVRNAGGHEVFLAVNGLFPETIESIRAAFDTLIPQRQIVMWQSPGAVSEATLENRWRRQAAERLREASLANLKPDVVHVSSLFEGLGDDIVTSIGTLKSTSTTAITLYDLIPLIYRYLYLVDPVIESWYERKLGSLRRAQLWLSISECSRRDAIALLNLPEEWVVNVSTAADAIFHPIYLTNAQEDIIRHRYDLTRPFVMYTGGIDHRKNTDRLIKAYANLPSSVRSRYQLAIVCSASVEQTGEITRWAAKCGLAPDELILTGFVPDADLVALYNLCTAFVFPSLYEGFGLPVLEAMSCGAPVIGSDTSSLPELIGRDDALFDPHGEDKIAAKLHHVVTNDNFREHLKRHGLKQATKFSWDRSGRRAVEAFEHLHAYSRLAGTPRSWLASTHRAQLAYVSPLPPEKSGIADYSAELLPELARHYDIDVVINPVEMTNPWIKANCCIRSPEWFDQNAHRYDRIIYHFGNSVFHQHMFSLLERHPGTVVLHDFFLSGVLAHMEMSGYAPVAWSVALYASHGYCAIKERLAGSDVDAIAWKYPVNLQTLQNASGVIVHSELSRALAEHWYGEGKSDDWSVIPLLRAPPYGIDRTEARRVLNLGTDDFVVCSFGVLGRHKLSHRLLSAWLASALVTKPNCVLIFVGENQSDSYGAELANTIHHSSKRITITGWVDTPTYQRYLAAADVGVQLRALSRGETSAAVLDCMNYGLATIVNAEGSMAELPDDGVWKLEADFGENQLVSALESLWSDPTRRQQLGKTAQEIVRTRHAPRACADAYAAAIEGNYRKGLTGISALTQAMARLVPSPTETQTWISLSESIALSISPPIAPRQLFIDISELVQHDAGSGIQRAVRSILQELLNHGPEGFRVEPVYATTDRIYRYARRFTLRFLGCPDSLLSDDAIEFRVGDVFLGLDLQPEVVSAHQPFYQKLRNCGLGVYFVVYDILPIILPNAFPPGLADYYESWLRIVTQCDGAFCISKVVAAQLEEWLKQNGPVRQRPFRIEWFPLGADIAASSPSKGLPGGAKELLNAFADRPTFLMVGTLEPRKGHRQALAAFEQLWVSGIEADLVIVGKQGWMVEDLVQKLRGHPNFGKHLHWFEGISDEFLVMVYEASSALLAASEAEGFGLPLIEAAQHKLPIIARDIPVFRDAAGEHAFYFSGKEPENLATAIKEWLALAASGNAPCSDNIPWVTWRQSAQQLVNLVL